jgi:hypothetical protein
MKAGTPEGPEADPASPRFRPRVRLVARAIGVVALVLVAAIVLAVVAHLIALRNPALATRVANSVLANVTFAPRSTTTVARVATDVFGRLDVAGLRVARGDTVIAAIDTLRVRHRLLSGLAGRSRSRASTSTACS